MLRKTHYNGHSFSGWALYSLRDGENFQEFIGLFPDDRINREVRERTTADANAGYIVKYSVTPVYSGAWEYDDTRKHEWIHGQWMHTPV